MAWRLAPCLRKLWDEANAWRPGRSKASDGSIGDASHAARKSDHNPDNRQVVCATDTTNDGIDVDHFVAVCIKNPRTEYVISRGKIYSRAFGFQPRTYTGSNPHDHHVHLSVRHEPQYADSTASWGLAGTAPTPQPQPTPTKENDEMLMTITTKNKDGSQAGTYLLINRAWVRWITGPGELDVIKSDMKTRGYPADWFQTPHEVDRALFDTFVKLGPTGWPT